MNDSSTVETGEMVTSFFARLDRIDRVLRIIVSDAPLRARFTIRGDPSHSVLLDLSERPARTVVDDLSIASDVQVAMRSEAWHAVLSGAMLPGAALGRREMLLRGSASHLARFVPLFDFAPMLYRDHQRGFGNRQEENMSSGTIVTWARRVLRGEEAKEKFYGAVKSAAYAMGYGLGKARTRLGKLDLFVLLEAMSRGIADANPVESKGHDNP